MHAMSDGGGKVPVLSVLPVGDKLMVHELEALQRSVHDVITV